MADSIDAGSEGAAWIPEVNKAVKARKKESENFMISELVMNLISQSHKVPVPYMYSLLSGRYLLPRLPHISEEYAKLVGPRGEPQGSP